MELAGRPCRPATVYDADDVSKPEEEGLTAVVSRFVEALAAVVVAVDCSAVGPGRLLVFYKSLPEKYESLPVTTFLPAPIYYAGRLVVGGRVLDRDRS